ncbi:MAG: ABC transporter permease subunit [Butyrivibrio sp.]|jgi:putative aldouronate transport system permease protein|nr:ABC transporter permease subunit [Butyrivibrio sp.]
MNNVNNVNTVKRHDTEVLKMKKKRRRWNQDDTELTLLGLPTAIWYVAFCYLPMFGLIIAFKKYKISAGHGFIYSLIKSKWAGISNFTFFLKSNAFGMLLKNTILYNLVFIILGVIIPVTLAIMINLIYSKMKSKVYQTMMFFPHFMSWVVVSYFVYAFLSPDKGLLNQILQFAGKEKIQWYSDPTYWPFILIFMQQWKTTGYSMVVYLASITGIDRTLYEAAVIDGADKWKQTKYITLPCLKPIVIMMFILNVGRIFYSDFGLFYQVTQRVPNSLYETVSTFDTYIYNALQSTSGIGRTAAASFFQSAACCITILIANWIVSKIDSDSAII